MEMVKAKKAATDAAAEMQEQPALSTTQFALFVVSLKLLGILYCSCPCSGIVAFKCLDKIIGASDTHLIFMVA